MRPAPPRQRTRPPQPAPRPQPNTHANVDGDQVEILRFDAHVKYLGRKFSFDKYHRTEIENRIGSAWRKFNMLRHELTSKTYPLKSRLKLFNGTITPTILYGCTAWAAT